jgi:hypothetical protein
MRWILLLAAIGGCGPSIEVEEARARTRAALVPPAYDGVTRCGPPSPPPPPAPPPAAGVLGFGDDASDAAADSEVMGALDKDLIARPIRNREAAFRACYLAVLERDPEAEGRVIASFQLDANGAVHAVEIRGFDAELDACVCAQIVGLVYPKFGSARFGGVSVSYPFVFDSGR